MYNVRDVRYYYRKVLLPDGLRKNVNKKAGRIYILLVKLAT